MKAKVILVLLLCSSERWEEEEGGGLEGKLREGGRSRPCMEEAARGQRRKWSVEDKDENYCPEDT